MSPGGAPNQQINDLLLNVSAHPEQTREPAVLGDIVQIEVVVEVSAERLLLFLITNAPEEHGPACWAHRQGEA